jgi:LPXTG-site transpeptidase (sortase) family protein
MESNSTDKAVELIRQKLAAIYDNEPDAKQELAESELPGTNHSKHQKFMLGLHNSGKPMAQIQAEWHQYYQDLNDAEKREVWEEFYSQSAQTKQQASRLQPSYHHDFNEPQQPHAQQYTQQQPQQLTQSQPTQPDPQPYQAGTMPRSPLQPLQPATNPYAASAPVPSHAQVTSPAQSPVSQEPTASTGQEPGDIKRQLLNTVGSRRKLQAKHHVQSLLFGLGFGSLVLLVVLFSFFNEVVIAPFIQPSRKVSATPIIVSPDGVTASDKDEVIIPKINVEIPLDFSATSTDEKQFEAALDKGVAHYPTTALPGQTGNASFFGHSSNNIFNPGKYKFAFVLLNELVPGDTFYITYKGVAYAYQVYDKKIVEATEVSILNPVATKSATAMLVTCDPPGTSLRRLVIWGEQVSPNPNSNTTATIPTTGAQSASSDLPGNGPTLWGRIRSWITGN